MIPICKMYMLARMVLPNGRLWGPLPFAIMPRNGVSLSADPHDLYDGVSFRHMHFICFSNGSPARQKLVS